jgi:hypothetical protein
LPNPRALSTVDPEAEALIKTENSRPAALEGISELLVDEPTDLLHAEKQPTKALPKWPRLRGSTGCVNASKSILRRPKAASNGSMDVSRRNCVRQALQKA